METRQVNTAEGPGELVITAAADATGLLLLGHGAGSDVDGWDLALLADRLPAHGVSVIRYRQPHRVAGRKLPGSTASLDRGWTAALAAVAEGWPGLPLVSGGHSAGARTACRGFAPGQAGVVALSFPLHPPGAPAKSRAGELLGVAWPVLVVQGELDTFGRAEEVRPVIAGAAQIELVAVPGAQHPLAPARSVPADVVLARQELIVSAVLDFLSRQGLLGPAARP